MVYLVTGGAGFIGSAVARLFVSSEETVARLLPVSLQQTGLLFEARVEAYRFGQLDRPQCRAEDLKR
jgi:nucleoside-diphosphate-sugar epimerase